MPDNDLQKQAEQVTTKRDAGGRFCRGHSGNPRGRPPRASAREAATLLDAAAEALTRKAVELALAGDPVALRLCLERIVGPRRGRPVALDLPPLANGRDLVAALAALAAATAAGEVTPDEAEAVARAFDGFARALEASRRDTRHAWGFGEFERALAAKQGQ